jgi:trigger factor
LTPFSNPRSIEVSAVLARASDRSCATPPSDSIRDERIGRHTLSSTETIATATPETEASLETSLDTSVQAEGLEPAHDHEHAHEHAHAEQGPALNPECVRDVDVVIPADEVSAAFRRIVKNYGRQARIPGFRAGKVPPTLIRSRFDEQIRQDVVEQLLPQHFRTAIEAKGLQPISQPQVTELELKDGEPLRFKALFEVLPEIALDGWQEIHIPREAAELTEPEFEAEMERMLDSRSTMEPVEEDRELADGDFAQISFTGAVALGEAIGEPIVGQDVSLEVGGKNTLPAFTEALRGSKPGQELKFEVTYPAEFGEARLAGRTVAYDVEVKAIKHRNAPELNDDLAKELGEYETMDEFKAKLREHLGAEKKRQSEAATKDKILEALADKYTFPIPESMVASQIDARLDRGLRALAQQGMTQEQMKTLDFARLRAAQRDAAVGEVQGTMLLDRVAQAENVEVAEAELDRELEMLSAQMREPLETLRDRLEKDGSVARVREQIRREKTGALLYEKLSS